MVVWNAVLRECVHFRGNSCCPSLQMTTTPRRFVIEDCDDHDRSRGWCAPSMCTSSVWSNRWCATVGNRNESHHVRPRLLGNWLCGGQAGERGMPRVGASGARLAVTVIAGLEVTTVGVGIAGARCACLRTTYVRLRRSSGRLTHSRLTVCPWWFPLQRPHMSARGPRATPTRPLFCPGLTPVAAQAGVDGWAGTADTGWSGWPYRRDEDGPYGRAGPWGDISANSWRGLAG